MGSVMSIVATLRSAKVVTVVEMLAALLVSIGSRMNRPANTVALLGSKPLVEGKA